MVGAFPPPVHGMAQVNANVKSALVECGADVTTCDLRGNADNFNLVRIVGGKYA